MMKLAILGAAVIAASALSSSAALAQWAMSNPDACQAEFASCTGLGTGNTPVYRYRQVSRRTAYQQPAAAGAPVGGWGGWGSPSAAYGMYGGGMYGENGWHGSWTTYAARNGIVCRPGTYYKGDDGLRHLCQ